MIIPTLQKTGRGSVEIILIACKSVFSFACATTIVFADTDAHPAVTIISQEHSLSAFADSANGYQVQHYDIKGRTIVSDPVAGTSTETTFHNPNPNFGSTERQTRQGNNPVLAGDNFSASLKTEVPGSASAFAELQSLAGYAGNAFRIDGSMNVLAETDTEPGWGATAGANAEYSVEVRIVGPSVVYVEDCDQVEIGMMADDEIIRYADICRFQTKSGPLGSQDINELLKALLPKPDEAAGTEVNADLLSGRMVYFSMKAESFKSSEGSRPAKTQDIAISIQPGCPITLGEPAKSPLASMVLSAATEKLPEATFWDETDSTRRDLEKEIELGESDYAGDDFRKQAARAAGQLANPIQAQLKLTFPGLADTRGVHTVRIASGYGETIESLSFDFDKADSADDIDAFIDRVVAALRVHIETC
jgi:hypothetical protein